MKKKTIAMLVLYTLPVTVLVTVTVYVNRQVKVTGEPNTADAYSQMNDPEFWIAQQKKPHRVIMTETEIAQFSKTIAKTEGTNCVTLDEYPDTLTAEALKKVIGQNQKSADPTYQGSQLITYEQ